jgi:hypothetical protein
MNQEETIVYQLPVINTIEDLEREFPDVITISKYNTYELFDSLYYKVYYAICACIGKPACKGYKIKFKFYPDSEVINSLSLGKFLLNINAWRPIIELNRLEKYYHRQIDVLDESFIVGTMMTDDLRNALETKVLNVLNEYGIPFETSSKLLKTVIERYQEASIEFALTNKASVMTYESIFLNDYRNSEKIRELNNLKISQELQTADVEELLRKKTAELLNEFSKTKNPIWYISKSGRHIKEKQIQELYISYGQIPDVSGNVIPYTMQGNGFSTGYVDPTTYYIAATGARLSAIMNKAHMGEAGYLSRNLILASRTLTLSKTVFDCGTKHLLHLKVTDSNFLHRLENKWYCENLGEKLNVIHYENCKHLIGKEIWVRSVVTCACGNEVCHVCYGQDAHLVMNMPGMAIFNTEVYSEPVSQNILSTKHLLFTAANKIGFSESFNKYFKFNAGDIYLKELDEWDLNIPTNHLSIRIEEDNVIPINQHDMQEYNTFGNNIESPFYIYNSIDKTYDPIEIINYESMFVDAESMQHFKLIHDKDVDKNYYELPLEVLSSELEGRLLSIDIKNNGLTDNLYMIMDLLNKNASKYDDYNKFAQDFFELLINAGIRCRHVQAEIILNRLIRDAHDLYKRPAFGEFNNPEYKILTLNQALLNTKAPTIGLSYQETKRQILGDALYDEKDGSSYLDPLYANKISTDKLKRLIEKVKARKEQSNNE